MTLSTTPVTFCSPRAHRFALQRARFPYLHPPRSEALKFCGASESDLAPFLERVKDGALRHALQYGVAFCHETMPAGDQEVVRLLFESGAVQVGAEW